MLAEALASRGRRRKGKPRAVSRRSGFFAPARKNGAESSVDGIEIAMPSRGLSRPAARAAMGTREELLRQRICRGAGCGAVFWICRHCDRGHRYCGERCRRKARRQQRRAANRRHQQSPEGRLDHRDRQRAYRERCRHRARVTDQPSPPTSGSDSIVTAEPSRSENGSESGSGRLDMPRALNLNPPVSSAAAPGGLRPSSGLYFLNGR